VEGRKKMSVVELAHVRSLTEDLMTAIKAEDEEAVDRIMEKCSIILSDWGM